MRYVRHVSGECGKCLKNQIRGAVPRQSHWICANSRLPSAEAVQKGVRKKADAFVKLCLKKYCGMAVFRGPLRRAE